MKTKLIEFKNQYDEVLRGIITASDDNIKAGVVFAHGFERNATVEKKFKMMASVLVDRGIASLRFDFSGCGLSDGDFSKTTIASRAQELLMAVKIFQEEFSLEKIDFIAHSLGACVLVETLNEIKPRIAKIVLIAPALNQKDLVRYYFARDNNPEIKVNWQNYKQYLNEEEFLKDCARADKMTCQNYIGSNYFLEAKDLDFSASFEMIKERILHIHDDADAKVPLESLNVRFENRVIVVAGDHDLERPDFWDQWFGKAVDFSTNV